MDSRNDITILDDGDVTHTFDIQAKLDDNETFRYLRLHQTGPNTQKGNFYFIPLSALEYFGILYSEWITILYIVNKGVTYLNFIKNMTGNFSSFFFNIVYD